MRTRTFKNNWTVVLLSFILASCAVPHSIIRIQPQSDDVEWNYGVAYTSDTLKGITVETSYINTSDKYSFFDVTVSNNSDMNYLVDPNNFSFVNQFTREKHKAIDPEFIILELDKEQSRSIAAEKNANAAAVGNAAALVATAVIIEATTDDDDRCCNNETYIVIPIGDHDEGSEITRHQAALQEDYYDIKKRDWQETTIRKTTLKSGYKISGKIAFPRLEESALFDLAVEIDDQMLLIPYQQHLIDARY